MTSPLNLYSLCITYSPHTLTNVFTFKMVKLHKSIDRSKSSKTLTLNKVPRRTLQQLLQV